MWRICVVMLLKLQGWNGALCVGVHGVYVLMGALKPVLAAISATFSVNSCDMHGGFTVSSSGFSAAFSVNICDDAWSTHCVFYSFCCFLYKYGWQFSRIHCVFYLCCFLCEYLRHAWRIHCVFCYLCCFLCKYMWWCMEYMLRLLLSQVLSL